ncbi:MAG TPA: hypothetical protein DD381_04600 [Lentisphaeria bacterium]|nr:MAG: hypothetical protein A2X47_07050 [Lentisphaerae bacterium GWF2_38_69]HBM15611.1 hypothetical protein [Lentisphaeria bacterium]
MKQKILKVLNALLAILILTQLLSGIFRKEIGKELFELIHEKGVILLIIVIIIHIILNWGWIKNSYFKK